MRAVVQRVSKASVRVQGKCLSTINTGFLVLLGVEHNDTPSDAKYLANKIAKMRVFNDSDGKMNLDLHQVQGQVLVVSQFTLHAQTSKGNRPSFIQAAPPALAIPLYKQFVNDLQQYNLPVCTGQFGADMQLELINDGPVTILIDSKNP